LYLHFDPYARPFVLEKAEKKCFAKAELIDGPNKSYFEMRLVGNQDKSWQKVSYLDYFRSRQPLKESLFRAL